ncbi:13135_t:CDS:2 [Acaulospora colombiana]|uniref:13135_t:CDS:1 n=1 Tax=Acaulospora colombiana TaxID=27376 RepID=A0ACA9N472_9GLOM|nr:13135_t:CDS:2 [Acaulospora colombiana]
MGKKPDIMGLLKRDEKILEETLDGMSFIGASCRPAGNQFGVAGLQIAGTDLRLNVLVKDLGGISRYFHLDHSEIPLTPHASHAKS